MLKYDRNPGTEIIIFTSTAVCLFPNIICLLHREWVTQQNDVILIFSFLFFTSTDVSILGELARVFLLFYKTAFKKRC